MTNLSPIFDSSLFDEDEDGMTLTATISDLVPMLDVPLFPSLKINFGEGGIVEFSVYNALTNPDDDRDIILWELDSVDTDLVLVILND